MSREKLESMNCKELVLMCKERGIAVYQGKSKKKKGELIDAILSFEESKSEENNEPATRDDEDARKAEKLERLRKVEIGVVVAFKHPEKDKVVSAKIVKKSTQREKLMVETSYGLQLVIGFEDVIWIKTGKRWPKGVYNLLKGIKDERVISE